jgi:hypothetical protein
MLECTRVQMTGFNSSSSLGVLRLGLTIARVLVLAVRPISVSILHSSHALVQLSLPLRTLQLKPTHSKLQYFLLLPPSLHFQRFRIVSLLPTISEIQFRVLSSL